MVDVGRNAGLQRCQSTVLRSVLLHWCYIAAAIFNLSCTVTGHFRHASLLCIHVWTCQHFLIECWGLNPVIPTTGISSVLMHL